VSVTGSGKLIGKGVTLYLACSTYPSPCAKNTNGATLTVSGSASVTLTDGAVGPGLGFAILADPNNDSSIAVTGGSLSVTGLIEAADVSLSVSGCGSVSADAPDDRLGLRRHLGG
jgi:hypothetical protein